MANNDIASKANRMAPRAPGSSPAKITFANGANAAVQLRAAGDVPYYISFKTTAGVCVATGSASVAVPTTNDPRFDSTDGWQDMILSTGATHIRLFGDGTGGTAYVWFIGS